MNTKLLRNLALPVLLALLASGCTVDDPSHPVGLQTPPQDGPFAAYVAIGNSLTAGYMDSGLVRAGQESSYPRLLATRLGFNDEGFSMPWIARPGIGATNLGDPTLVAGVLHFNGTSIAPLDTTPLAAVPRLLENGSQLTPYHNQGVPGATVGDALLAYSRGTSWNGQNPYFDFITRGETLFGSMTVTQDSLVDFGQSQPGQPPVYHEATVESASMTYQALATFGRLVNAALPQPVLATVWLGNNDVLGGATSGNPTQDNLTPPAVFATRFGDVLQLVAGGALEATGMPATIIVANVPDVADAAFFMDEATFNAALAALSGGQLNAWPGGFEEGSAELLTFTVLSWVGQNIGNPATPIPSKYTLTAAEVALVRQYITAYNQYIAGIVGAVQASGAAKIGVVDANALLHDLGPAQKTHFMLLLPQNDIAAAAAKTYFALDGVHPNNRGYGYVANAFIDAVNATAGTTLEAVDLGTLDWDPTYGQIVPAKAAGFPQLSPEAAAGMTAIWR
jgi:hypothetical protein